ncbi:MAG: heterodisulfide reductase-related iron-sulfur binding cluster [Thermoplasmata archaeon]
MKKTDTKAYSLFTGCLIPSKFPFIEKGTRKVLESLGMELHDIEGASCCPNQMAIKSSDDPLWYVLAARNLCLAEKKGYDILSLCNGCYDTLKTVNSRLKGDDEFRRDINDKLAKFGLEFRGEIDVKHLIQVLHDDIGMNTLEKKVIFHLRNLKCASFEGCHVKRPMDHMGFDDPDEPSYLEDLIKVIGGDCVSYSEEHSCCGGGLSIGRKHDVAPAARRVLVSALNEGARAIVVNCPFCFAQFYRSQKEINDIYADHLHLPVFYITQLVGLAFGLSPEELGMEMHYENSVGSERELVNQILGEGIDKTVFTNEITKSQLELCTKCFACTHDCPTAMTTSDYHPEEILELVLQGKLDEAVKRDDIWYCMNCHECVEHCPQSFGMVKLIFRLKNLAVERGIYPEVVGHRLSEIHETGYSFAPNIVLREELNLPKITLPDIKKLRKLMEKATTEESDEKGD